MLCDLFIMLHNLGANVQLFFVISEYSVLIVLLWSVFIFKLLVSLSLSLFHVSTKYLKVVN